MKNNDMSTTPEQIEKNRKYVKNELKQCYDIAKKSNLRFVCVIHWSPISKQLESRIAFFKDNFEACLWRDRMNELYSEFNVPFEIYNY